MRYKFAKKILKSQAKKGIGIRKRYELGVDFPLHPKKASRILDKERF